MDNTRVAVYTALFGGYDRLRDPSGGREHDCDYICFTDQAIKSKVWKIVNIESNVDDPVSLNRRYKILPHLYLGGYDKSLYLDANILVVSDPSSLAHKILCASDMACPRHIERDCIYKEAEACIQLGKAPVEQTQTLLARYRSEGFPDCYGLTENNIIFRNHHVTSVTSLMNRWWTCFETGPARDQLSLMYLCWKYNFPIKILESGAKDDNPHFRYRLHASDLSANPFRKLSQFVSVNKYRGSTYSRLDKIAEYFRK